MKTVYPVVFTKIPEGYMASVPDFPLDTSGADFAEAIYMARDAIGIMGVSLQDDGTPLPAPSSPESISCDSGDIVSMVDIDFDEYRRANDIRTVRRNVSLPSWLNFEAEKAGVNVSSILQTALKRELRISEPAVTA